MRAYGIARRQKGVSKKAAASDEGTRKTLYARCGGIFGVAAFVDRCMDAWMADPTLNANDAVATWHQRAQRCGFKFLVTQLMGYLCGGPQVYTGRDMATSHKHLNISEEQWGAFVATLHDVCDELGPAQAGGGRCDRGHRIDARRLHYTGRRASARPIRATRRRRRLALRAMRRRLPDRALLRPPRRRAAHR